MRAVAHRGRATPADEGLLRGEERTWRGLVSMSAKDPKRTFEVHQSLQTLYLEYSRRDGIEYLWPAEYPSRFPNARDLRPRIFLVSLNLAGVERYTVAGKDKVPPGRHVVTLDFNFDGDGVGQGGQATLTVDGNMASEKLLHSALTSFRSWRLGRHAEHSAMSKYG